MIAATEVRMKRSSRNESKKKVRDDENELDFKRNKKIDESRDQSKVARAHRHESEDLRGSNQQEREEEEDGSNSGSDTILNEMN